MIKANYTKYAFPVATLLALLLWQIAGTIGLLNPTLVPTPSRLITTFFEMPTDFFDAFSQTSSAVVSSFLLASTLGIGTALILGRSQILQNCFLPLAMFFQTMPIIAIAPLLVIYFGFGLSTVIAAAAIVSIFPVIASSVVALNNVPPDLDELFLFLHSTPTQRLLLLQLPLAYPGIYSGLRVAAGLSVVGAVAGEFVAGGGLGGLIDSARTQQRIDIVFCCLLLLALIGMILLTSLRLLHEQIIKWRPLTPSLK